MKFAHLLVVLIFTFGIIGCGSQPNTECWGLSSFSIPDFKITPLQSDSTKKSTLLTPLINNRGTNVTVWNIMFKNSKYNNITLGDDETPQIYVWNCSSEPCDLVATFFPFKMAPGQRLIVNGTIPIPYDQLDNLKIDIIFETPRSSQNHTDTGFLACYQNLK